jgi:hypothetical protein
MLHDGYWAESMGNASSASNDGPFNLELVSSGPDWRAIRYDEGTGESWLIFPDHWRLVEETETIDNSRYIIRMAGEDGWIAVRIDANSGCAWMIKSIDEGYRWVGMEMTVQP